MYNADRQAREGAQFLDNKMPGWVKKITRNTLNMESPFHSVLGLLYGDYHAGLSSLQIFSRDREVELGFDIRGG